MDFDAGVKRAADGRYELTLRMLPRSPALEPNARRIAADSCPELGGALVVAIAMALGEQDERPLPPAPTAAPDTVHEQAVRAASRPRTPLRYAAGLAAELDVGALPNLGLGGEAQFVFGVRALRVVALGALFQAQEARPSGSPGAGEIRLAFGGLLACGELRRGTLGWLGCGGFELGKMWGRGQDVSQPDEGDALWRALRFELGLDITLSTHVALSTRAGASVPLGRPEFSLEGEPIHQPAPVSFRGLLGLAFSWSSSNRSGSTRRPSRE